VNKKEPKKPRSVASEARQSIFLTAHHTPVRPQSHGLNSHASQASFLFVTFVPHYAAMQIHGSCTALSGAAVVLLGPSGSGKSDLAFRLLDRGFELVADDRVDVEDGWASPPAALAGLLELRGLGLIRVPHLPRAEITLAVQLGEPERMPAPVLWECAAVPMVTINPRAAAAPQLVEWALDCALKRRLLLEGAIA